MAKKVKKAKKAKKPQKPKDPTPTEKLDKLSGKHENLKSEFTHLRTKCKHFEKIADRLQRENDALADEATLLREMPESHLTTRLEQSERVLRTIAAMHKALHRKPLDWWVGWEAVVHAADYFSPNTANEIRDEKCKRQAKEHVICC